MIYVAIQRDSKDVVLTFKQKKTLQHLVKEKTAIVVQQKEDLQIIFLELNK